MQFQFSNSNLKDKVDFQEGCIVVYLFYGDDHVMHIYNVCIHVRLRVLLLLVKEIKGRWSGSWGVKLRYSFQEREIADYGTPCNWNWR